MFDPYKTGFLSSSSLIEILKYLGELDKTDGLKKDAIEKLFREASFYGTRDEKGDFAINFNGFFFCFPVYFLDLNHAVF